MNYDVILFDLDGTLTESDEGIIRSAQYSLAKNNYPVPEAEQLKKFVGPPLKQSFMRHVDTDDEALGDKLVADYRERYREVGWKENKVYPGIAPMLKALHERGAYLAVASAKPLPFVRQILEYFGLDGLFQKICAFEFGGEKESKTDLLRSALPEGWNPERSAMVGDRMYDMDAARELGVAAVGVEYGYGSREELIDHGADELCATVSELSDLLLSGEKPRGAFLSFEGGDGCGKSTQLHKAAEFLTARGYEVLITREPGGTEVGEKIRALLLDVGNMEMTGECEAYLFAASRSEHVRRVIRPAVESGKIVLSDRFLDSSVAYQAFGRELGTDFVRQINERATDGVQPNLTFLFQADQEEMRRRLTSPDRIEREGRDFTQRVALGYIRLAEEEPDRIRVIDARRGIDEVFEDVRRELISRAF